MSVTINNPNAAQDAMREGAKRLQRTAVFYWNQLQARINIANPGPRYTNSSKPGEYPHKRTGRGAASIILDGLSAAEIMQNGMKVRAGATQLGSGENYMLILEFKKNRLLFLHTLDNLKPQLQALLTGRAS